MRFDCDGVRDHRVQGWYDDSSLSVLYRAFRLSSACPSWLAITIGFVYELLIGVWWDVMPISSADWGTGMGFTGASWIILAGIEEFGWMGGLWPAAYCNTRVRKASAAVTHWWYRRWPLLAPAAPPSLPQSQRTEAAAASDPSKAHPAGTQLQASSSVAVSSAPLASAASASASASFCSEWVHLTLSTLLTGLVWSMWHWPFILLRTILPPGVGYVPGTVDTPLGQSAAGGKGG